MQIKFLLKYLSILIFRPFPHCLTNIRKSYWNGFNHVIEILVIHIGGPQLPDFFQWWDRLCAAADKLICH